MSDSEDFAVTYAEAPPTPEFVLEPVYLKFMPPEDDVLLDKELPLPAAVSPTADLPRYILESDLEEDPEEDNEDPEEDTADYLIDREDDDEEEESFEDDIDDEEEDEDEDKEEEEQPAPTDSVSPPVHRVTARMFVRGQTPISLPLEIEVETVNEDVRLQALVDRKKVILNEASVRHNLRLDDAEGTTCLPNSAIFEELERIGYGSKSCKIKSKDDSESIPNELKESTEVKESSNVPLVKKLVSDAKLEKKSVVLNVAKIEYFKAKQQEKQVRKLIKYAEMYMSQGPRGNQRN
nr:hypothetical protein [Tanacetum cinerariifolium]